MHTETTTYLVLSAFCLLQAPTTRISCTLLEYRTLNRERRTSWNCLVARPRVSRVVIGFKPRHIVFYAIRVHSRPFLTRLQSQCYATYTPSSAMWASESILFRENSTLRKTSQAEVLSNMNSEANELHFVSYWVLWVPAVSVTLQETAI